MASNKASSLEKKVIQITAILLFLFWLYHTNNNGGIKLQGIANYPSNSDLRSARYQTADTYHDLLLEDKEKCQHYKTRMERKACQEARRAIRREYEID